MEPVDPPVKPTSTDTAPTQAPAKLPIKERFSVLLKEYGSVVFGVYFGIFFLCILAFSIAIKAGLGDTLAQRFGVELEGAGGLGATLIGAWVVTKAIQLPRMFATLALTPIVARLLRRSQVPRG
jgi:hypothetical protein